MQVRPLAIDGAFEITPVQYADERGVFLEWFKASVFRERTGGDLHLAQANCSVSARGVIRGIHFSTAPDGQAKYVTCVSGAVLDVVVDIRVGSPTFGTWDSVRLDDVDRRAVYIAEGLGHAFMSLTEGATAIYLSTSPYAPDHEHAVHAFDPTIAIDWPRKNDDGQPLAHILSERDAAAPTLLDAREARVLPRLK